MTVSLIMCLTPAVPEHPWATMFFGSWYQGHEVITCTIGSGPDMFAHIKDVLLFWGLGNSEAKSTPWPCPGRLSPAVTSKKTNMVWSDDGQTQGFPAEHCPKHHSTSSDLLSVHRAPWCHVAPGCIKELWLLSPSQLGPLFPTQLSKLAHWLPGLTVGTQRVNQFKYINYVCIAKK